MKQETKRFFNKQLFLGKDLKVTEHIVIRSPKIKDILAFGEERYFNVIRNLIAIPPAEILYSLLPDKNIDHRDSADLDFIYFSTITKGLSPKDTRLLFGNDLDLSKFELSKKTDTNEYILFNPENGAIIDYVAFEIMLDYITQMHNLDRDKYKNHKSENEFLEKHLIIDSNENQQKEYKSLLLQWIEENPAYLNLTFFALFNLLKMRFSPET